MGSNIARASVQADCSDAAIDLKISVLTLNIQSPTNPKCLNVAVYRVYGQLSLGTLHEDRAISRVHINIAVQRRLCELLEHSGMVRTTARVASSPSFALFSNTIECNIRRAPCVCWCE